MQYAPVARVAAGAFACGVWQDASARLRRVQTGGLRLG